MVAAWRLRGGCVVAVWRLCGGLRLTSKGFLTSLEGFILKSQFPSLHTSPESTVLESLTWPQLSQLREPVLMVPVCTTVS